MLFYFHYGTLFGHLFQFLLYIHGNFFYPIFGGYPLEFYYFGGYFFSAAFVHYREYITDLIA